jgi:hypothetical protein
MPKAQAHQPASSRATVECLVFNGWKRLTAGWLYGQNGGPLLLCSWAKHLDGFVGRCVYTWGADFIAIFFCTLSLMLTC